MSTMDAILVFEKITAEEASVVYAIAGAGANTPPGYERRLVKLRKEGDNVNFTYEGTRGRLEFQFVPSEDIIQCQSLGSLGGTNYSTFKRLSPSSK